MALPSTTSSPGPPQSFDMGSFARMNNKLTMTHSNCSHADACAKMATIEAFNLARKQTVIVRTLSARLLSHTSVLTAAVNEGNVGTDCEEPLDVDSVGQEEYGNHPIEYHYMYEVLHDGNSTDTVKVLPSEVLAREIHQLSTQLTHAKQVERDLYKALDQAKITYNDARVKIWESYRICVSEACALSVSFQEFNEESWEVFAGIYPWLKLPDGVCKFHLRHKLKPEIYITGCKYGPRCKCAHVSISLPKLD